MITVRSHPDECNVGDHVARAVVAHWPKMSNQSAVRFKRFIGKSTVHGQLHRMGNRIFEVGESDLALCVYNHSRQF